MNRYRKGIAAALGAIVQVGILLDEQLDAGTIPESWVPWVRLIVAVATVVGVVWVPNAPRVVYVRGRGDVGAARTGLLGTLAAVASAALLVITAIAAAAPADAHRRVEHVDANRASLSSGVLVVSFDLEQLHGRTWTFLEDDGAAVVELHHVGAAAGPGGHWEAYPTRTRSGGEGHLRVDVSGLPYWDAARVVHRGIASSPVLPEAAAA